MIVKDEGFPLPTDEAIRFIDSHCHLQLGDQGLEAVAEARANSVEKLICVGTDSETSRDALRIARAAGEGVFATIGLHPHDAKNGLESIIDLLAEERSIDDDKLVAIGECGLDYYYQHSPRNDQREVFALQIEMAQQSNLTLVIHTREAWNDTFDILKGAGDLPRTVIHCFTGGPDEATKCLDLGFYLSFSGIVTFPKAADVQEAARICPPDRMLIETDSPFLAPVPHRGKPNRPAYLPEIARFISELKGLELEAFSDVLFQVTKQAFNLR